MHFLRILFQISKQGDGFWINNAAKTSKPEGENLELQTGNTIRFKSGDTSDGNTKFKMTFKKKGDEDPKTDPNNCKPFTFDWDKDSVASEEARMIPRRMMDDIGPTFDDKGNKVHRIFRYLGPNKLQGVEGKPSAYYNGDVILQQKKSTRTKFNYFVIG